MSSTSRSILEQLTQDYLWMRTLCSQKAQGEAADKQVTQRLGSIQKGLQNAAAAAASSSGGMGSGGTSARAFGRGTMGAKSAGGSSGGGSGGVEGGSRGKNSELSKAVQQMVDLASEELRESALQDTKEGVFGAEKK